MSIILKNDNSINFDVEDRIRNITFEDLRDKVGLSLSESQQKDLEALLMESCIKIFKTTRLRRNIKSDEEEMRDLEQQGYIFFRECLLTFDLSKFDSFGEALDDPGKNKITLEKAFMGWFSQNISWRCFRALKKQKGKRVSNRTDNSTYTIEYDIPSDDHFFGSDINIELSKLSPRARVVFILQNICGIPIKFLKFEFGKVYEDVLDEVEDLKNKI